uniref:PH domain-containing protein n=1 Tax=Anopheles coluzzii TaxID=1518534 RepID=A0A8W7PE19_ANOCL
LSTCAKMMTERRSDFVLKSGYMVKRSQNKKRFTPVNYKTRWFELTRFYLSYYDIGNLEHHNLSAKRMPCLIISQSDKCAIGGSHRSRTPSAASATAATADHPA